jgi:hypothetical protein
MGKGCEGWEFCGQTLYHAGSLVLLAMLGNYDVKTRLSPGITCKRTDLMDGTPPSVAGRRTLLLPQKYISQLRGKNSSLGDQNQNLNHVSLIVINARARTIVRNSTVRAFDLFVGQRISMCVPFPKCGRDANTVKIPCSEVYFFIRYPEGNLNYNLWHAHVMSHVPFQKRSYVFFFLSSI